MFYKPQMNRFLAKNSKKVKVTQVQLAHDLNTDEILMEFMEPVSLCGSWNEAPQPTGITDAFLKQYNVSNLAKDDRTLILSGLLNTKLTMKGIEDFAKKIHRNKYDHINVDYGIIGYDQLGHLEEYRNRNNYNDISCDDKLVNWNGQNVYRAPLYDVIQTPYQPLKQHIVSVSLERSSTGIIINPKLPQSYPGLNDATLSSFNTISKAVSMKSDYTSIAPQQYEFDSIRIEMKKNGDNLTKLKISAEQSRNMNKMEIVRTGVTPSEANHLIARFLKMCRATNCLEFDKSAWNRKMRTTSTYVALTDELYDLLKEHAPNMEVRDDLSMINDMSPEKYLNLLEYTKSLPITDFKTVMFKGLKIGRNLNRKLCTDEVFMKLVRYEVQRVGFEAVYFWKNHWTETKKSLITCIPDISLYNCDYVEVDLTDALLKKMAEQPDKLPLTIDLGKAITKFSSKGLEALLKALDSSEKFYHYKFGVIQVENLVDIDRLLDKRAMEDNKKHTTNNGADFHEKEKFSWDKVDDKKPTEYKSNILQIGQYHHKRIELHQVFDEKAEQCFLQKLKTGKVEPGLIRECSDYALKGKMPKLKDAVESGLIADFHATHNLQYIQFAFERYEGRKSYNYGFNKYKDILLSFFSSTQLDDPVMIAGQEYVQSLPNDAKNIVYECIKKKKNITEIKKNRKCTVL